MKWMKRREYGSGYLGQGYQCGDYIIEETYRSQELQRQHGGKVADYYWMLKKGGEVVRYGRTAKMLKEYAETI